MKVTKGQSVRIAFELKVKGGEVIESSAKNGSIDYVHGQGKLLPCLESRLEGMSVGEEKRGVIPAKEAFGDESQMPTKKLRRKDFPADAKVEKGLLFEAKGQGGLPLNFKVIEAKGDDVTVRLLHPLMGKDLEFYVKVLVIDDPQARKRESVAPPPPPAAALGLKPEE
ncbi:MAG TPA: FKBP-type peptidyl-prolyl cis-trans isomerase [Polyangia bacterium]|jgi:FKBP-type peptidyl-prolyl cis-trans isomerase SlyD